MLRLKAFILFMPLFALLAEGILVASICPGLAVIQGCVSAPKPGEAVDPGLSSPSCHHTMAGMSCCSTKAGKGTKAMDLKTKSTRAAGNGTGGKGCTSLPCLNCPLCCAVTFKPVFRVDPPQKEGKIEFAVMHDHTLAGYDSQPWRPPDTSIS